MADTKHNTAGILGKYAWLTTAGRVAYLLLLAALTLGLLTAAQISSAFLKASGSGSASEKYRNALSAASDARLGGLRGLDGELTASSNLASPEARSAVAAWLELSRPAWENDADRQDRYCKAMERQGYGSGKGVRQSAEYTASCLKPQENVARDAGLLNRICAFLACIGTLPGNLVAALVIVPLLAQTAAMAMAAGALGGGIARLWEEYGNGPTANAVLETISARLSEISVALNGQARNDPAGSGLQDELRAVHAHLDRLQAGEGMGVATFLGAVSALMIWLLATGGLFVLSGGEEASAASPNVLLALSLVAGLARGNVIELAFSIADQTFKPERQEELRKAREKSNAETSKAVAEAEAATAEADKVKAEAAKARADAEAAEAAAKKAAEGGGSDQGGGAR